MIVNAGVHRWNVGAVTDALLEEKFLESKKHLDFLCNHVDNEVEIDLDWGMYHYGDILKLDMEWLDGQYMTYAALFNEELELLSERSESVEAQPFEPFLDKEHGAEFTALVRAAANREGRDTVENGEYIMRFAPDGAEPRDMYIYFRWVPTDSNLNSRFLVIVAVSEYSVISEINERMSFVGLVNIALSYLGEFAVILFVMSLGHIYEQRSGKSKYRERGELF
jgi:hypothetical protein